MRLKKIKTNLLSLFLASVVLASFSGSAALGATVSDLQREIEQKARELEEVNKKIEETQETLSAVAQKGKTLSQEINRIDNTIKQTELGIRASTLSIEKLSLEIASLEQEISLKEIQVGQKRSAMIKLLQDFQIKDNEGFLTALLKHETISQGISETQNILSLNDSLLADLASIRELKSELSDRLGQVSQKQQQVKQENASLKARKSTAEDQLEERSQILKETKNQEKEYQALLTELEKQQQSISQEIEEIETKLRASFDSSVLPGKRPGVLSWPTKDPYITQEYGATAFAQRAYKSKFHNGIDLRARPAGQPIYAAADGKVIATGDNGRVQYGRYILIEHENNLSTLYAHLSRFAVSSGSSVKRGELIGYSGNTGYSFAPHLHFVVYWGPSVQLKSFPGAGLVPVGTTVNPKDYL